MIISRTPLRISFFGGGTDFPEYFNQFGGAVLGTAIDKYIYHTVSHLPSWLFDHSLRFAYRKVEQVSCLDDIEHVPFREILRRCNVLRDVEVNLASDLPSFTGLGSSSSFTVGLLNGLNAFRGRHIGMEDLAKEAICIEREILKESVGLQDQIFAAYGGFNLIKFSSGGNFNVHRLPISSDRISELNNSLVLFYTGINRRAQEIESAKIKNIRNINDNLNSIHKLVDHAFEILVGGKSLESFGKLLNQTWLEKRNLDPLVSNQYIDKLYKSGIEGGALGGKLLGAGGGGFMLFYVNPDKKETLRTYLSAYHEVHFKMNAPGSTIIHS